jgi:hypothetical protein
MLIVNQVLWTRDGRKIGNGIVLDHTKSIFSNIDIYTIKTDFGNLVLLSREELENLFFIDGMTGALIFDAKSQLLEQIKLLYNNFKGWLI